MSDDTPQPPAECRTCGRRVGDKHVEICSEDGRDVTAGQITPADAREVIARAIDPSGFDQTPAYEAWAAPRRQSAYDKAKKYLAALLTLPLASRLAAIGVDPAKDDHPYIWLEPNETPNPDGRQWCEDDVWTGNPDYEGAQPTLYIRADLAAAEDATDGR